jgi:hypothetical protein
MPDTKRIQVADYHLTDAIVKKFLEETFPQMKTSFNIKVCQLCASCTTPLTSDPER